MAPAGDPLLDSLILARNFIQLIPRQIAKDPRQATSLARDFLPKVDALIAGIVALRPSPSNK